LFFYLSKILGFFLNITHLVAFALLLGFLLLWRGRVRAAKWVIGFAAFVVALASFTPLPELMLFPLEQRFARLDPLPEQVDGIVLLGGAQRPLLSARYRQPALNAAAETLTSFTALARRYPQARLVFTGGSGDITNQRESEANTVRMFLREQGLDPARVMYEERSRNTYENAVLSLPLAQPKAGERWIMIAAAASMPRAMGVFRKAGWVVTPYPADYNSFHWRDFSFSLNLRDRLGNLSLALHEWVGLAVYLWTGKLDDFFPAP
jgi:uncharacterized SAM-binding protein YcdF (DUF218 family)